MLDFSPEKILVIGILAFIVLGPNRLPQAARTVGKLLAEVRKVTGSFQTEVRDALAEPRDALSHAVGDLGLSDLRNSVRQTVTGADPVPGVNSAISSPATVTAPAVAATPVRVTEALPPVPDDPSLN